jgi:hypothetical protein
MNYQCPLCTWVQEVAPTDRLPPWCRKCGADVKAEEWQPVNLPAPVVIERAPEPFDEESEGTTSVTSTGPRPWLNPPAKSAPAAPLPPPPAAAAEVAASHDAAIATAAAASTTAKFGGLLLLTSVTGVGLLVAAVYLTGHAREFAKTSHKTTGEVVVTKKFDPMTFGLYREEVVIRYEVNKNQYELPAGGRDVGDRVQIVYPPSAPKEGRVNSPLWVYRWPLLTGGIGLVLLLASLAGAYLLPDRDKPAALPVVRNEANEW